MRQSLRSATSGASSPSSPGAAKRCVQVKLLNKEVLNVFIDTKTKLQEVFNQVCDHLGLRESEYFGLAQLVDGEYHFVELDLKIQKLCPRGWRLHGSGDRPPLVLYFRVQFYVDHIALLRERVTRQLYYLQLKDNLLHYNQLCGEERCFLLASYALQADQGIFSLQKHTADYFDPREYFPAWVISRHGPDYITRSMPAMHRDLGRMTRMEAQMHFIKDVSSPPVAHNLHFYRLKKRKTDDLGTAWLGICPKGVEIYEQTPDGFKSLLSTFLWPDIGKLYFEKKKFEIRAIGTPEGRKFTYFTGSDDRSKYLLSLCRSSHCFQMSVQPKLAEMRHIEAEEKKRYREKLVHVDGHVEEKSSIRAKMSNGMVSPPSGNSLEQRVSVISSTSSNTTSGIVSDKMHISFDDSEDDRSAEIFIDSPPACQFNSPRTPGGSFLGSVPSPQLVSTPLRPSSSMKGRHLPMTMTPSPGPSERSVDRSAGTSISRTSSGHSQKGALCVLTPIPNIPEAGAVFVSAPRPAEMQVQRVAMAPTMTVSSTPVTPKSFATEPRAPSCVPKTLALTPMVAHAQTAEKAIPQMATSITNPKTLSAGLQPYVMQPVHQTSTPNGVIQYLAPSLHSHHQMGVLPQYPTHNLNPQTSTPISGVQVQQYHGQAVSSQNTIPGSAMPPPPSYNTTHTPVLGGRERSHTGPPQLYYNVARPITPQRPSSLKSSAHSSPITSSKPLRPSNSVIQNPLQILPGTSSQMSSLISNGLQYSVNVDVHSTLPNSKLTVLPTTTNGATYNIPDVRHPSMIDSYSSVKDQHLMFPFQHHQQVLQQQMHNHQIAPLVNQVAAVNQMTSQNSQIAAQVNQMASHSPQVVQQLSQIAPQVNQMAPQVSHIGTPMAQVAPPKASQPEIRVTPNSDSSANAALCATMPSHSSPIRQGRANSFGKHEQLVAAQRVSPNPENRRPRERRSKTCPVHGFLADEIRNLEKNHSVPLLTALVQDQSLLPGSRCSCGGTTCTEEAKHSHSDSEKHLSSDFNSSRAGMLVNEPGTLVRPMSWHSDTFNLDRQLQAQKQETVAQPLRQNSDGSGSGLLERNNLAQAIAMASRHRAVTNGGPNIAPIWSESHLPCAGSYRLSQSHGALANIGLQSSPPMFPSRLTSGGHSPNSSVTMDIMEANMGMA